MDSALQLVHHVVPTITSQAASVVGSGPNKAQQALINLHTSPKEIEFTESLVVRNYCVIICHVAIAVINFIVMLSLSYI